MNDSKKGPSWKMIIEICLWSDNGLSAQAKLPDDDWKIIAQCSAHNAEVVRSAAHAMVSGAIARAMKERSDAQ
jgi:hypothetical protein